MLFGPTTFVVGAVVVLATAKHKWTYKDSKDWGSSFAWCRRPGTQSPIDILTNEVVALNRSSALHIHYNVYYDMRNCGSGVKQVMEGNTWAVKFPLTSREMFCTKGEGFPHVMWNGRTFYLHNFHYHSPSEHTINGLHSDMEVHHVHVDETGRILVISVLVNVGYENAYMRQFWDDFPERPGDFTIASTVPGWRYLLPYLSFAPYDKSYYHYMGSSTTPPCYQHVTWIVLKTPMPMSISQLNQYRRAMKDARFSDDQIPGVSWKWKVGLGLTNREVQSIGDRTVYSYDAGLFNTSLTWPFFILILVLTFLCCAACVSLCVYVIRYRIVFRPWRKESDLDDPEISESSSAFEDELQQSAPLIKTQAEQRDVQTEVDGPSIPSGEQGGSVQMQSLVAPQPREVRVPTALNSATAPPVVYAAYEVLPYNVPASTSQGEVPMLQLSERQVHQMQQDHQMQLDRITQLDAQLSYEQQLMQMQYATPQSQYPTYQMESGYAMQIGSELLPGYGLDTGYVVPAQTYMQPNMVQDYAVQQQGHEMMHAPPTQFYNAY